MRIASCCRDTKVQTGAVFGVWSVFGATRRGKGSFESTSWRRRVWIFRHFMALSRIRAFYAYPYYMRVSCFARTNNVIAGIAPRIDGRVRLIYLLLLLVITYIPVPAACISCCDWGTVNKLAATKLVVWNESFGRFVVKEKKKLVIYTLTRWRLEKKKSKQIKCTHIRINAFEKRARIMV